MVEVKIGSEASDCKGKSFHVENQGLEGLNLMKRTSLKSQMLGGNKHFRKDQTRHFMIRRYFSSKEPS